MTFEVELALGADLTQDPSTWMWTAISRYVQATQKIVITRGKPDEYTTAPPAQARMTLINDGRFVPRNPSGAYFGSIGRNTPLRVTKRPATNTQVDAFGRTVSNGFGTADVGGSWAVVGTAADYQATGSTARVTMSTTNVRHYAVLPAALTTGDIAVKAKTAVAVTGLALAAGVTLRYADANNNIRGEVWFNADTTITARIVQRVAGVETVVASAVAPGVTHAANTFFWIRAQTVGTTSQAGGQQIRVKCWLDGTTEPDGWATQATVTSNTAAGQMGLTCTRETGNTNTSATIDFDSYVLYDGVRQRFTGHVPNWPTVFADGSASVSYAPIIAYGLRQRLQLTPVLKSAMTRTIPKQPEIVAFWALEDNAGAISAVSAVAGVQPLLAGFGVPRFGTAAGPPGAGSVADFSQGGTLHGQIPTFTSTSWRVEFGARVDPLASGANKVLADVYSSGGVNIWEIVVPASADSLTTYIKFVFADGSATTVDTQKGADDGAWHQYRIDVTNSGGQALYAVTIDGQVTSAGSLLTASYGQPTSIVACPANSADRNPQAMSSFAVWNTATPALNTFSAFTGFLAESASARFLRLGTEEILPFTTTTTSSMQLGPQRQQTLAQILDDLEATDQGLLFDGLAGHLTFLPHDGRYNRSVDLTLNVASKHLAPNFQGTDDDQQLHNDITATAPSGSSFEYKVTTGANNVTAVGTYPLPLAANVAYDSQLPYVAQWKGYQGTNPDLRYPQLQINLVANPGLVEAWLNCDAGTRFAVTGMSSLPVLPSTDLDLFLDGYTETCTNEEWTADLNAVSASRWTVFQLDVSKLDQGVLAL